MAKILVVDDEQVLVKGIKFNLEHEGYQVEVGYDGEQAVELARESREKTLILALGRGSEKFQKIGRRAYACPTDSQMMREQLSAGDIPAKSC